MRLSAKLLISCLCILWSTSLQVTAQQDPLSLSEIEESNVLIKATVEGRRHHFDALIIKPKGQGSWPLAAISHGNSRDVADARNLRLRTYHALAEDMARRGYVAAIFARRGFARSTGNYHEGYGSCATPDFASAIARTAMDYRSFIEAIGTIPEVDDSTIIAIGQSGGGVGVLALANEPVAGLKAVINFSGGRGSSSDGVNCGRQDLVKTVGSFGSERNPPSLWLYSSADRYFGPDMVQEMNAAYVRNGGQVVMPAIGPLTHFADGHRLIRRGSRPVWRAEIDRFLNAVGLPNWNEPPAEHAVLTSSSPLGLGERGRRNWVQFLGSDLNKAFAKVPGASGFGWVSRKESPEAAIQSALAACRGQEPNRICKIVAVNDHRQ